MNIMNRCRDRMLERALGAEATEPVERTLALVERILSQFPGDAVARLIQARLWIRQGRVGAAHDQLLQLAEQEPNHIEVRMTLVGVLLCLGDYRRGMDHLLVATRLCAREDDTRRSAVPLESLWRSYLDGTDLLGSEERL